MAMVAAVAVVAGAVLGLSKKLAPDRQRAQPEGLAAPVLVLFGACVWAHFGPLLLVDWWVGAR
ncbi:MAG: hypothetical protein CM15mP38_0130 [Synechococcus sp.]|nr:MAG: hypothetical protein CM15mP38_0130 [Synechococcus sp.]